MKTTKEEKEREEMEIERKVWSKCSYVKKNFQKKNGIVMNMECYHSYCKECI